MPRTPLLLFAPLLAVVCTAQAPPTSEAPLDIVRIGDGDEARTAALDVALRAAGHRLRPSPPDRAGREVWWNADVVVVDLPADAPLPAEPARRWDRPTLMVGACAARLAAAWRLPDAAQIEARYLAAGPEFARVAFGDGRQALRQGNLFHVPAPVDEELSTWAGDVAKLARDAARYRSDRAIVQRVDEAADRDRRDRVRAALADVEVDTTTRDGLIALPRQQLTTERTLQLLTDLVPEGRGADTTVNNWRYWLAARDDALRWDPVGARWRLDTLAQAHHRDTAGFTGAARADAQARDAAAVALARRVARRYGAAAFDDLRTFRCRVGGAVILWDRVAGVFRQERADAEVAARGNPWLVAALDTAADVDLVQASRAPKAPRVSARGNYQAVLRRAFLPHRLLEPSTGLELTTIDGLEAGEVALAVRPGGRGIDLSCTLVLVVDAEARIVRLQEQRAGRSAVDWVLLETTPCGPMQLPTKWEHQTRRALGFELTEPEWNPTLPDGLGTSTELLAGERGGD